MDVITIIENTRNNPNLISEHGLCFYFNSLGNFLVDTGAGRGFIHNCNALGINLHDIDYVVITHNHYDHIGGLVYFLELNIKAKVIISRHVFDGQLIRTGLNKKVLSCDKSIYNNYLDRFVFVDSYLNINDSVSVFAVSHPEERFISKDREMHYCDEYTCVKDDFRHEICAAIDIGKLVIISSCSHNGIINIVRTAKSIYNKPVNVIIGGLHLNGSNNTINCDNGELDYIAKFLNHNADIVYTGHCTGDAAYNALKHLMLNKLNRLTSGKIISI